MRMSTLHHNMRPTRNLYTSVTTINVGSSPTIETYHVHSSVLVSSSLFFAAALSPSFAFLEASTNVVNLPGVSPAIFVFWVQWAYTRSLSHEDIDWEEENPQAAGEGRENGEEDELRLSRTSTPTIGTSNRAHSSDDTSRGIRSNTSLSSVESITQAASDASTPSPSSEFKRSKTRQNDFQPAFYLLIRLYKLAAFLGCEALRNDIINEVARIAYKRNTVPGPDDTWDLMSEEMADGLCVPKSLKAEKVERLGIEKRKGGLRGLVVDLFVGMKTEKLIRSSDGWNDKFLKALVLKMKERSVGMVPEVPFVEPWKDAKIRCLTYHEHMITEKCSRWINDV